MKETDWWPLDPLQEAVSCSSASLEEKAERTGRKARKRARRNRKGFILDDSRKYRVELERVDSGVVVAIWSASKLLIVVLNMSIKGASGSNRLT